MRVALDIDGVLADFLTPFIRLLQQRVSHDRIDPDSITDPSFVQHPFLSCELVSGCMIEVANDPLFWSALTPLASPEHFQRLETLSQQNRLVFITHRYETDGCNMAEVTHEWLKKQGVANPRIFLTQRHKSELIEKLEIDLFVDDRYENCQDVADNTEAVVLMPHRPYNRTFSHPRVQRIQDLADLFAHLE